MSEPSRPANVPRLQVEDARGRRVVPIDKPVFRIGRRSESDFRPDGVDISREHAEILQRHDGAYVLRDCGWRYGTFVNDEPVTERQLRNRDRIRLGSTGSGEITFLDASGDSQAGQTQGIIDFHQISALLDGLRAMGSARVLD